MEAMTANEVLIASAKRGDGGHSKSSKDSVDRAALFGSSNPHSEQNPVPRLDIEHQRTIPESGYPELPYVQRGADERTTVHWGQRKLCMSEIEFFHNSVPRDANNVVVIYAGAGPGTHLPLLFEKFPLYKFVLVDPVKIEVEADVDRILVYQDFFTDKMAHEFGRKFADSTVLFISDIRSELKGHGAHEEGLIRSNMADQRRWHGILRPFKSMLKFRLPYTQGVTTYLKGELFLPVWGPQSTTECRLVVDADCALQEYDHGQHERRMSYFNKVARPALYPHGVRACGIDHCYDCTTEVDILRAYLGFGASDEDVAAFSAEVSRVISDGMDTLVSKAKRVARRGGMRDAFE